MNLDEIMWEVNKLKEEFEREKNKHTLDYGRGALDTYFKVTILLAQLQKIYGDD